MCKKKIDCLNDHPLTRGCSDDCRKCDHSPVEVLAFVKGGHSATIVTDGEQTRSYEYLKCKKHDTLKHAIAYLESQGYTLVPDCFPSAAPQLRNSKS